MLANNNKTNAKKAYTVRTAKFAFCSFKVLQVIIIFITVNGFVDLSFHFCACDFQYRGHIGSEIIDIQLLDIKN